MFDCKIIFFKGLVFDVDSQYDKVILESWKDSKGLELKALTELPELEAERSNGFDRGNGGGGFRRSGGFGGGGGGGRDRGFGGGGGRDRRSGGGQRGGGGGRDRSDHGGKRKFESNGGGGGGSSHGTSKKIKFDD